MWLYRLLLLTNLLSRYTLAQILVNIMSVQVRLKYIYANAFESIAKEL